MTDCRYITVEHLDESARRQEPGPDQHPTYQGYPLAGRT